MSSRVRPCSQTTPGRALSCRRRCRILCVRGRGHRTSVLGVKILYYIIYTKTRLNKHCTISLPVRSPAPPYCKSCGLTAHSLKAEAIKPMASQKVWYVIFGRPCMRSATTSLLRESPSYPRSRVNSGELRDPSISSSFAMKTISWSPRESFPNTAHM